MPAPGTNGNIPDIRKIVTGSFRFTAKNLETTVIAMEETKLAKTTESKESLVNR